MSDRPDLRAMMGLRGVGRSSPMQVEPDVQSERPVEFRTLGATSGFITASPVVKAALVEMRRIWPRSVPMVELYEAIVGAGQAHLGGSEGFARALWPAYVAGIFELRSEGSAAVFEPSTRPEGSPVARSLAEESTEVTNLEHRSVGLTAFERLVLRACDGRRDREAIVSELMAAVSLGQLPLQRDGHPIEDPADIHQILVRSLNPCLVRLATAALLRA
jgi:hypothetical protein